MPSAALYIQITLAGQLFIAFKPWLPLALAEPIVGIYSTCIAQSSQHADAMALHLLEAPLDEVHSCAPVTPPPKSPTSMPCL